MTTATTATATQKMRDLVMIQAGDGGKAPSLGGRSTKTLHSVAPRAMHARNTAPWETAAEGEPGRP